MREEARLPPKSYKPYYILIGEFRLNYISELL